MDYIRYVIYMNEYKEGKKQYIRSGFARLERRNNIWNISVVPEETGIRHPVPLYIVGKKEDGCYGWCAGEFDLTAPGRVQLGMEVAQFIRELDSLGGILIGGPEHYLAGACTGTDCELSFDTMKKWPPETESSTPKKGQEIPEVEKDVLERERNTPEGEKDVPEGERNTPEGEKSVPVESETVEVKEEEAEAGELEKAETGESVPADSKNPFAGLHPMYPFEDDEMDWCYEMEPRDFGGFQADLWHLASNSFLLQGYYNYRHLMYAHRKGKNYIGVPGQFHRREQYLASRFGFPQFKGTQKKRVTMGDFGYWLREI